MGVPGNGLWGFRDGRSAGLQATRLGQLASAAGPRARPWPPAEAGRAGHGRRVRSTEHTVSTPHLAG